MSAALSLLLAASPLAAEATTPGGDRTNVVLIMADDLGAEWLSCYNPAAPPTPHLDALASAGVKFTRGFSQPLCTPTRVTLMTGRYNFRNYVEFGLLPPAEPTFGDRFREAGYRTGVFGKWQLSGKGSDQPDTVSPDDWGFDEHLLWQLSRRPGHGSKGTRYWKPTLETDGEIVSVKADDYGPDLFTDALIDFATAEADRPFFAYYPMVLTHDPFVPTPESGPPAGKGKPTPKHFPEMVRHTDRIVGRIVAALEEAGLRENTVVLFCGDNGTHDSVVCPTPYGPYRGGKRHLNDAGTWVPLIVAGPAAGGGSVPARVTDDRPIDFTDLLPAVCTLAGVPVPEDADGISPFAADGSLATKRREAAFIWYDPRHGFRTAPHAGAYVRDVRYRLYADGRFIDAGDPLNRTEQELTEPLTEEAAAAHERLAAVLTRYEAQGGKAPVPKSSKP